MCVCIPPECQSESAESVRKAVFQHCIEQLNKDRLQSQMAKELVGKLLIEVRMMLVVWCESGRLHRGS